MALRGLGLRSNLTKLRGLEAAAGGGLARISPIAYQAQTLALEAGYSGAGNAMAARRKKSLDRFFFRMNRAGIMDALLGLYIISPNQGTFMVNAANPGTYNCTKAGAGNIFSADVGITSPATNADHYDTGIPLQTLNKSSVSMGIFVKSGVGGSAAEMGAQDSGGNGFTFNPFDATNKVVARIGGTGAFTGADTTHYSAEGLYGLTVDGTAARFSHNGIKIETTTVTPVTFASNPTIWLQAANGNSGRGIRVNSAYYITSRAFTEREEKIFAAAMRDLLEKIFWGELDITYAGVGDPVVNVDVLAFGSSPGATEAAYEAKRQGRTVAICGDVYTDNEWALPGHVAAGLANIDVQDATKVSGLFAERLKWEATVFYSTTNTISQAAYSRASRAWMNCTRHMFDPARTGTLPGQDVPIYLSTGIRSITKGTKSGTLVTNDGRIFNYKVLIGADYDGQSVLKIGAPYIIGSEAAGTGAEASNGHRTVSAGFKPYTTLTVDPYVSAGVSGSGLLPDTILPPSITTGAADPGLQANNLRLAWAKSAAVYAPFDTAQPPNFDALRYEAAARCYVADPTISLSDGSVLLWKGTVSNRYDINSGAGGISSDVPQSGVRFALAGSDAERIAAIKDVYDYTRGFIWWHLYSGDSRIPAAVISGINAYSQDAQSFLDPPFGDEDLLFWPPRMYLRDPQYQMKNAGFVLDGNDIAATDGTTPRSVKTVAHTNYPGDHHLMRRVAYDDGSGVKIYLQGSFAGPGAGGTDHIAPIPLEAIVPDSAVCDHYINVAAPSMTKVAWASARMEEAISLMGQSAGMIAAIAIENDVAVQSISYSTFATRMAATPDSILPILPVVN